MLANVLSHWQLCIVPAFTLASILLNAIGASFQALGKAVPGWVGDGLSLVGKGLHFLNGSVFATKPAQIQ